MAIWALLGFAGALVSAGAQMKAGAEQERQAKLSAELQLANRDIAKAQGKEQMVAMLQDYQRNVSSNNAFFAYAGRDVSDRSVDAFMKRQEEIVAKDVGRASKNIERRANLETIEAKLTELRGVNARRAANVGALGTILSGAYQFSETMNFASAARSSTSLAPLTTIRPRARPF